MTDKYPFTVIVHERDKLPRNHSSPNIRNALTIADKFVGRANVRLIRIVQDVYVWHPGDNTRDEQ